MKKWKEYKLGSISKMIYGKMPPENIMAETGYPIYTGYRIAGFANKYLFEEPKLIVVARGVGGTGDVKISPAKAWITNLSIIIDLDQNIADQKFLCELLGLSSLKDRLDSGSAQSQITINSLEPFRIKLPCLSIQQKIAAILSAYDDLIENNLKRIKLLEEMAQITYEEWFVRLKFPGHKTTPLDSETGLPVGWYEAEITAISFINANSIKTKDAPETIKYIDIASADTGFYQEPEAMSFAEAPSRARRKVNFGDTIFSTVRPNRKTYSLILEDDPMLVASTGFAVLTPKIEGTFPFVYLTVANQSFVDRAVAVAGGAAYPAINQNDFEKIKIIKPDDALIKLFSEKVINNFIAKRTLIKQNQLLKEARDILLPRLMTGMIDVEQLVLPNMPSSPKQEPQAA